MLNSIDIRFMNAGGYCGNANLTNVNLRYAKLTDANLRYNDLTEADLYFCRLGQCGA